MNLLQLLPYLYLVEAVREALADDGRIDRREIVELVELIGPALDRLGVNTRTFGTALIRIGKALRGNE